MRVEALEIGTSGIVRLRTDGGFRFIFRLEYLKPPLVAAPCVGEELDPSLLAAMEAAAQVYAAESKAMALLARAEHTRWLLVLKLRKRGVPEPAIASALDRLERLGCLDDERYARAWAQERLRKRGEGPARLRAGLVGRGVGEDLARRVSNELLSGPERQDALVFSIRRLLKSGRRDRAAVLKKLRGEGWKPSELSAALESISKQSE